jgi:hypothetical protein
MPRKYIRGTVAQRIDAYTDRSGDCWLWTGSTRNGYGRIIIKNKLYTVHRLVWELTYGEIPDGLDVLHHCDVRPCLRPDHLWLGTHGDNMRDMARKGRWRGGPRNRGSRCRFARLREEHIPQIRNLARTGMTQREIGEIFGVGQSAISVILSGKTWKHI